MAELAGINLSVFLEDGKGAGARGQTPKGRGRGKVGSIKPSFNLKGASSGVKHFSRSRELSVSSSIP